MRALGTGNRAAHVGHLSLLVLVPVSAGGAMALTLVKAMWFSDMQSGVRLPDRDDSCGSLSLPARNGTVPMQEAE